MILVFNGPPRSGKDLSCDFLRNEMGFAQLSFKEQLFLDTFEVFSVPQEWFMENYDQNKEVPYRELGGKTKRQALIHTSENVMKPKHGSDYYGVVLAGKIKDGVNYCLSDGGFVHEILPLINRIGAANIAIVQLHRNGCDYSSDSRSYIYGIPQEHISDHIPQLPVRMYRIDNDSAIADLNIKIKTIVQRELNDKEADGLL